MANDFLKTPYDAWQQQRCHPNAPAGGGGPGCFTSADPFLRSSSSGWQGLPHPDSPAARYLTPQEIRAPDLTERARAVVQAYTRALRLAPAAVYRETGCQLDQIIDGLLPGLLQMLAALGISAMAGASTGAAVGFFLGGVGAAPGAIVGGELGLEAGTALLAWMGLGFLAVAIGQGMGELTGVLRRAIHCAWQAPEHRYPPFEIDRASEDLARAVGILFRLILQGLLAYVLKNGAVSAGQAAASTGRTIIGGGTRAAADATLAEVSALLRKSKLPDGFVVWLERNWEDLKRNPKLTSNKASPAVSSQSSSAATPSELKALKERQGSDGVTEHSGNESQSVAERANHEKGAFAEYSVKDYSGVPNETLPLGARGPATAWDGFNETLAGGPVRDLNTDRIRVTTRGIRVVEKHTSRFGTDEANQIMIDRLRRIEAREISATQQDLNFYSHELREYVRYRKLGWETGVPSNSDQARMLWLQTHSATLDDYNLPLQSDELLYHPDALKALYGE